MLTRELSSSGRNQAGRDLRWRIQGHDDEYDIVLAPYEGLDFSKMAVLFCGQGAMSAGVSSEGLENHPLFQKRFMELDELARESGFDKPSDYIGNPERTLSPEIESIFSGLCLYTTQVAMFDTLIASGHIPRAMTAHSFGEFAQLTAAQVIPFAPMVRFLIERQKILTRYKGSFAMFAVSHGDPVDLSQIPYEIQPANYNTEFQTVFVCRESDFANVKSAFRAARLACVRMKIDVPYHTTWLEPARRELEDSIRRMDLQIHPPKLPFVSSVTQEWITAENFSTEAIRGILLNQLTAPVRFPEQIRHLKGRGIHNFFELSPVDVLEDFVAQYFDSLREPFKSNSFRKYFKGGSTANKTYEKLRDSKFFSKLDSALKSLTGYSVQQIRLEDRIREDLGIDSIKKAEIVFEIVDSMTGGLVAPANLADLATFGDVLEFFETSETAAELNPSQDERPVALFEGRRLGWRPKALVDFTASAPNPIRRMNWSDVEAQGRVTADEDELIVLDARGESTASPVESIKDWLEVFRSTDSFGRGVILLHSGDFLGEGLSGLLLSLSQEKSFVFKSIRMEGGELTDQALRAERADFYASRVLYRSGVRFVREYTPLTAPIGTSPKKILAFGGLGGVGRELIKSFSGASVESVILVGRTPEKNINADSMKELRTIFPDVGYVSADVQKEGEAYRLLTSLQGDYGPFDIILHNVGVEISEPLDNISDDNVGAIVEGKVRLAEALANFAKGHSETSIIINSSIVSEFGSRGQSPYGAANAFLNGIGETHDNILTILWPGWQDVGVAAQAINAKSLKLQGLTLMSAANGREVFKSIRGLRHGTIAVLGQSSSLDFSSIGQNRHEFSWLLKPASRDYSLFVVPGLTQEKLPYLRDHLVKRACIFPASGSMALMLFRAYIERGDLGHIQNFTAHNFLVVRENQSSVTLVNTAKSPEQMSFEVRSHQLLAKGDVVFGERTPARQDFHFTSRQTGFTDFDQNLAVYTGPAFELAKQSYIDPQSKTLVLDVDLETAPTYIPISLLDKLHRLIELSFNTSHSKALLDFDKFTVPKSIDAIEFYKENFGDHRFYTWVDNIRPEGDLFLCDIWILNHEARPAMFIKNLRSIVVGDSKTSTTQGYTLKNFEKTFF